MDDESEYEEFEEGEYIVERIINHKFVNGKCFYLLKWKDFDDRDNTWEEESSLDCPDLLEEYHDLNIERIEQDRIIAKKIENDKKKKRIKKQSLFKYIIDTNSYLSSAKKNNDKSTVSNNLNYTLQKQFKEKEIKSSDFISEITAKSSISKTTKLTNSNWLTIIGHKTDTNGQLLFSIVTKYGKIIDIPKKQLIQDDYNLYLKYLEESLLLKFIEK